MIGRRQTLIVMLMICAFDCNSSSPQAQPVAKTTPNTERVFEPYNREDSSSCSTPGAPNMGRYGGSCTGQYMLNGGLFILHVSATVTFHLDCPAYYHLILCLQ